MIIRDKLYIKYGAQSDVKLEAHSGVELGVSLGYLTWSTIGNTIRSAIRSSSKSEIGMQTNVLEAGCD